LSTNDERPLLPASQLLDRVTNRDSALGERFAGAYGHDASAHEERSVALTRVLRRFLDAYGDLPCAVYRAPARLSLNPHSDHQGAWVPYGLHLRELLSVVAPAPDHQFELVNTDSSFAPLLSFRADEEIARAPEAWEAGWLPYIESTAVSSEVRGNLDAKGQGSGRRATLNYIKAAALRLRRQFPERELPGLRMALSGNIAQGGGQSSSSALVVTAALATTALAGLPLDRKQLAEMCGEAEWYVGTRGGSGDHAAILLGSSDGLVHLCFRAPVGIRDIRYSGFPEGYQLIVANSQTRSEKSAEERLLFNAGIFAYRFAFLALKQAMRDLGLPADTVRETASLGDVHTGRIPPETLYRLLLRLPEYATPAELAARYPETFGPAARSCFGTDDLARLPPSIPLRGAAVYGLARVDRGRVMPGLLDVADEQSMGEFGHLMTVTHDGDRLQKNGGPYADNRSRLSDACLTETLAEAERGTHRPLRYEPGFYGASIPELDRMVDVSLEAPGVLGAGLMGAGGGGYVLILARQGTLPQITEALTREYYTPLGKEPDVEAWHPTAAACRLA